MNRRRRRLLYACRWIAHNLNLRDYVRCLEQTLDDEAARRRVEVETARREYAHWQRRRGDAA